MKKIVLFIAFVFILSTTLLYAEGVLPLNSKLDGGFSKEEENNSEMNFRIFKDQKSLASNDDFTKNSVGVINSSQVSSTTDLKSYTLFVVSESGVVEEVNSQDKRVDIIYRKEVKLFGFIPVFMKYKARVSLYDLVEGEVSSKVKVKEPWWYIFSKREELPQEIAKALEEKIDLALEESTEIEPSVYAKVIGTVEGLVGSNLATALETSN